MNQKDKVNKEVIVATIGIITEQINKQVEES